MLKRTSLFTLLLAISLLSCNSVKNKNQADSKIIPNNLPQWALGGFERPKGANPIISPNSKTTFYCPMQQKEMAWEESDTFNPAATVMGDHIYVLYRAEDNSAQGIGKRTSRIGLAKSKNGIKMERMSKPVLYPDNDNMKEYDWPGGCEDPRVTVTEDGMYVMLYTSWNRDVPRLSVATSYDLVRWEKHGPAFAKAHDGRFKNQASKAASIVTKIENDKQVITKVNGKYMMYWGEHWINIAYSDDLINWTPTVDKDFKLDFIVRPRKYYFDSALTECGPPAIVTNDGILLLYNGKNRNDDEGRDKRYNAGTYSAGQILFDKNDPAKILERLDVPFFRPMEDFEKSGQYVDGTVFIEGLTYFKNKWYLYYGCADSKVSVAIYDPAKRKPGDPIPILN